MNKMYVFTVYCYVVISLPQKYPNFFADVTVVVLMFTVYSVSDKLTSVS